MSCPSVTAIIVNWNGGQALRECLESLACSDYPKTEIVLVDNASSDGSAEEASKLFPGVRLLCSRENLGYAGGSNVGMRYALASGADYLLLLNNDVVVDSTMISELVRTAESPSYKMPSNLRRRENERRIGILGPKVLRYDERNRLDSAWGKITYNHVISRRIGENAPDSELQIPSATADKFKALEVDCVYGCAIMIKRAVVESIGFLDPSFFMYQEEVDYCKRARDAGFKVVFVPSARAYHRSAYSLNKANPLAKTYLVRRNSVLFMRKHGSPFTWAKFAICALLSLIFSLAVALARRDFSAFKAKLQGYCHGFTGKRTMP